MPSAGQRRFWKRARVYFRRFRITFLFCLFAVIGVLIYLGQVGLPGFLQRPLLRELQARGVDLEFSRLRLQWFRGLVADDVRFGRQQEDTALALEAREASLQLRWVDLLRGRVRVEEVGIRNGRGAWFVNDPKLARETLGVDDVQARLRLLPGDLWILDDLRARFAGVELHLSAGITNASAVREWTFLRSRQPLPRGSLSGRLIRLADLLEQISFGTAPELRLKLDGDAQRLDSFVARLSLHAPEATTPWGNLNEALLTANLTAATSNTVSFAEFKLTAASAETPWGGFNGLESELRLDALTGRADQLGADFNARVTSLTTSWADVTNAEISARWVHALTDPVPLTGEGTVCAGSVATRWAAARTISFSAKFARAAKPPPVTSELTWWTNLYPYEMSWIAEAQDLDTAKLAVSGIRLAGTWKAPELAVAELKAGLDGGALGGSLQLDVNTRRAAFTAESAVDVQKLAPVLTPRAAEWLARYSWAVPPHIVGSGMLRLPAWTNRQPDWRGEVLPTLCLAGALRATNAAFQGVPMDWVTTRITYTNLTWTLPDLVAGRPEGQLRLFHQANDRTRDYYFRIESSIDPRILRPVFKPEQQRAFEHFSLTTPPLLKGEVWGRWRQPDLVGFKGWFAATNVTVREQTVERAESVLAYTNRLLTFHSPRAWDHERTAGAEGITVDFRTLRIHFTNAGGDIDAMKVARIIGPKTAASLEPYRFGSPPTVRVEGYAPLKGHADSDLRFHVAGGPFAWWRFHLPRVAGDIRWLGDTVTLTNVTAGFYDGTAEGHAAFNFQEDGDADYRFRVRVTRADLRGFREDVFQKTNILEGTFGGWLEITNAHTSDPRSWFGDTNLRLRDGLIWDVPIFGVLTQPLKAMFPGLTLGRVTDGRVRGIITNSVLYTEDLDMRAPALRIQYRGTLDLEGNVNARAEAEPLRDAWFIGPVISFALKPVTKIMEFRVTGTLSEPKAEPLYFLPKMFLMPLHPIRTLEDLFDTGQTNAPPVFKEFELPEP